MNEMPLTVRTPDGIDLDAVLTTPTSGRSSVAGLVVLVHGITADRDESGAFSRLATKLASKNMACLRFSFRGHGSSALASEHMTVAGEAIDLKAVLDFGAEAVDKRISIVAASFGAVSVGLMSKYLKDRVLGITFWNPVLDVFRTFVKPQLPWGARNFTGENISRLYRDGYFLIDDEFRAGVVFWEELHDVQVYSRLRELGIPILIIHGDRDTYVPYEVSADFAADTLNVSLQTVCGADHGFENPEDEAKVIESTVEFICHQN